MTFKEYVMDFAAKNSNALEKIGNWTKLPALAAGPICYGVAKSSGIEDPGALSRYLTFPSAVIFSISEAIKCAGEYARDWKKGETDKIKNAGYTARILAPLYAAWFGSDGVWSGENDVLFPVVGWIGGEYLTKAGERRVMKRKERAAELLYSSLIEAVSSGIADTTMTEIASKYDPDFPINAVAEKVPLKEIEKHIVNPFYTVSLLDSANQ